MFNHMIKPELLAPAGDWKSFIAAVEAGADAVYFGGKDFSARNYASNFSREEIKKAVDYAHIRGVKSYAAANILIKDAEFAEFFDYINFLYAEGIDALIVQDLGVLNLCRKYWPDLPLHASTQMAAHNLNDVLMLEKMGFRRIVLARELILEEIREIKNKSKIEIECFVHGALCFSYSGQCYMSSMIGGRSGNRGKCAQPCRKKYVLADSKTGKNTEIGGYLLSTKDLCALDILDKMQFIDSLKIEGRMKSAAYVAGAVGKYRKHIDSSAADKKISSAETEADKKELAALFNRGGFSHGYLLEKKPKNLVSPERSKNFGIFAGEAIEVRNGAIKIKAKNVGVNDGLEIWGRGGQEKNAGFRAEKISGDIINIFIEGDIRAGDKVYKNFDYKLNKRLDLFSKENYRRRLGVRMDFFAEKGKSVILKINGLEIEGKAAEKAERITTSEKTIREQLSKLGNTPFIAEKINIAVKGGLNIPLSSLNALRREAVSALEEKIVNSSKRGKKTAPSDTLIIQRIKAIPRIFAGAGVKKEKGGQKRISVQSDDPAVLKKLADKKIYRVYASLPVEAKKFREKGIEVYQVLPRILRRGERLAVFENFDGFLVPALGYLRILAPGAKKIGNFSLNIFNNFGVAELKKIGFSGFTASVESVLAEINNLSAVKMEKEAVVYGYLPLMIAEHCALFGTKYCKKGSFGITDEKRITFPLLTDCANCRMQILNSRPLYFTDINELEADNIRLIHTIETPEKFLKIVDGYLSGVFGSAENATTGHFYRGVE